MKTSDSNTAAALMSYMRKIGNKNTKALSVYESFFKELKKNTALQESAQGILDIIAGRT